MTATIVPFPARRQMKRCGDADDYMTVAYMWRCGRAAHAVGLRRDHAAVELEQFRLNGRQQEVAAWYDGWDSYNSAHGDRAPQPEPAA